MIAYLKLFVMICISLSIMIHNVVGVVKSEVGQTAAGTPITVTDKLTVSTGYKIPQNSDGTPYNNPADLTQFPTNYTDRMNYLENMISGGPEQDT